MATVTVKTAGGDYTSLSAAEAGEQADLTASATLIIECYAMEDTAGVTIAGWTTDATHLIKITTPTAERHDGKWNTSKYRLNVDNGIVFQLQEDYIWLDGLQVTNHSPGGAGRECVIVNGTITATTNRILVTNCILKGHGDTANSQRGYRVDSANTNSVLVNTIIYGTGTYGIQTLAGSTLRAYNCTVIAPNNAFYRDDSTTFTAKNCYGASTTGAAYQGTITQTTCAADDTTATVASLDNIAADTSTFTNVTGGSEDFHLPSGSPLLDVGTDLSGDADYPFSDDIDGETRSGSWDIGADELIAGGGGGISIPVVYHHRQRNF